MPPQRSCFSLAVTEQSPIQAGKGCCWVSGSPSASWQPWGELQSFPSTQESLGARSQGRWGQPQAQHPDAGPGTPNHHEAGNHSDCNKLLIVFEEGRGLINYLWNEQINQAWQTTSKSNEHFKDHFQVTAAGQVAPYVTLQVSPIELLIARLPPIGLGIELYNDAPNYCLDGVMGWLIISGSSGFEVLRAEVWLRCAVVLPHSHLHALLCFRGWGHLTIIH